MEIWHGRRYPLGASYNGTGTNFAMEPWGVQVVC